MIFFGVKSWFFTWNIPKISRAHSKIGKIWFFGVKSWFFTRNTPKISRLPPLGAINLSAPLLTWNPGSAPDSGGNYCMTGHNFRYLFPGADPGFQVRRGALKFFLGVFRVENHDFTTGHMHLFHSKTICPLLLEFFEWNRYLWILRQKIMFSNFRGAAGAPPPPGSAPGIPRYYIVIRAERPIAWRFFLNVLNKFKWFYH